MTPPSPSGRERPGQIFVCPFCHSYMDNIEDCCNGTETLHEDAAGVPYVPQAHADELEARVVELREALERIVSAYDAEDKARNDPDTDDFMDAIREMYDAIEAARAALSTDQPSGRTDG